MLPLETVYKILFKAPDISRIRLSIGAHKNILAMTADSNGGLLTPYIASTQTKVDAYDLKLSKLGVDLVGTSSDTITLDYAVSQVGIEMHLTNHLVQTKVLNTSAIYNSFFPLGLEDVNHLTRGNVLLIIDRIIAAATANSVLFPGLTAIYNTHRTQVHDARDTQVLAMGGVSADRAAFDTAELNLQMQLTDNFYEIRKEFPLNMVKGLSYWDEASFYPANHHVHRHFDGTGLPAETTIVAYHGPVTARTHIQVRSKTADVDIQACLLMNALDPMTGDKIVHGNSAHTWLASTIGPITNTYLVLKNLGVVAGDWEIDVID